MQHLSGVLWIGLLSSVLAQGADFRHLRADRVVPQHCREVVMNHFDPTSSVQKLTFSTLGAERKGFTNEVHITRSDAGFLYDVFHSHLHDQRRAMERIRGNQELHKAYNLVIETQDEFKFDYRVEGEILEAVALGQIHRRLPSDLFVTGGITYRDYANTRVLGEIDIWVAEKDTCKVVQIGEVKLNTRLLGKAKAQLQRFTSFIRQWQNRQQGDSTRFQWPWEGGGAFPVIQD